MITLTVLLFAVLGGALVCKLGTAQPPQSNCTVTAAYGQDSCISATFHTPLVGGNGTDVYTCGNCSIFQSIAMIPGGFLANVACCSASDLCQTVSSPPPSPPACDALVDQSSCTARQDCYWCGAGILGVDLCQSFIGLSFPGTGGQQLPPFALPLVVPPPVCSFVAFQQFQPAYTVDKLTLAYLEAYGFPSVGANVTVAAGISLDVLSRYANTRVMNDTESFCTIDDDLRNWCGVNTTTDFKYCIVSETWPQYDIWGWIENTTFTSQSASLNPIYPAFCACPVDGRAYYLPTRIIDSRQHYAQQCRVELTLLSLYIVLIVVSMGVFLLVIWDTVFHLIFVFYRKKKLSLGSAFASKSLLVAYFLVAIPAMVVFTVPPRGNNAIFIISGILNILGIVLIYFAFAQAIFCFMGIVLNVQLFGASRFHSALGLFKWVFFVVTSVLSLTMIALVSALSFYTQELVEFRVQNLTELAYLSTSVAAPMTRALVLIIMITQFATWVIAAVVLLMVGRVLFRLKKLGKINELIVRYLGLVIALVIAIPEYAMLVVICYFGWISYSPTASPWDSFYLTNVASAWFQWALFVTQVMWLSSIAYAMRTNIKKSWLVRHFSLLLGSVTSRTTGDSDAATADSGTDSVFGTNEVTFNDD